MQRTEPSGGIFISYRREDSAASSGRLYDRLSAHFGEARVFMDIDTIKPGQDFVETIERYLARSRVVLAVIGKYWAMANGKAGRRLEDESDFVRIELAVALQRNLHIIPVLVSGAQMPASADLPEALRPLVRRQAVVLPDVGFHREVDRLIEIIEEAMSAPLERKVGPSSLPPSLPERPVLKQPPRRDKPTTLARQWPAVLAALAVLVAAVLLVVVFAPFSKKVAQEVAVRPNPELVTTEGVALIVGSTATISDMRQAIEREPSNPDLHHDLAALLQKNGDLAGATDEYRRATELPPKEIGRAFLFRDLGQALERAGDLDGAIAAIRKSVGLWPLNRGPSKCEGIEHDNLIRLYQKKGDLQGALEFYKDLHQKYPQDPLCRERYQRFAILEH